MTTRYPLNSLWTQLNSSDKFGSLAYTKSVDLDEKGYLKLSPRAVNIFDDSGNVANVSDQDFNIPVAFGRYSIGDMRIATTEDPFNLTVSETAKTIAEDNGADNPNLTFNSHGVWFHNKFHESTASGVSANSSGTWSVTSISLSSSTTRHYMTVFKNRNTLCISDANTVVQYSEAAGVYTASTTLTLPSDFEVIGMAYNNNKIGIITRLGNDSEGQNADSFFFIWDGSTTSAGNGYSIGSSSAICVIPYKSSFVLINSLGQLLYFNGGGFEELAHFPFYVGERDFTDFNNVISYGDNMVVSGDLIYINIGFNFNGIGRKGEEYQQNNPSGIWCYDPQVGLYHRYSPSNSRAYFHSISQANVNTTTDIFTTSGVIPVTGSPVINTSGNVGGLSKGTIYYVIRLTSTTFKLATTKANADAGSWINITSADTNNYFYMYDIIDYGISYFQVSGAIGSWGTSNLAYRDFIFGGRLLDTSLNSQPTLCMTVPFLENRGHLALSKSFSDAILENTPKLFIKHRPLDTYDKILVKIKLKEYVGLPTSSPNDAGTDEITWTSSATGTTTTDLSEAKTAFDAGEELELELTAGIGAGQLIKITNITESGGTYTLTVEDDVTGYSSGLKSYFVVDNWKVCDSVDYSTQKEGVFETSIAKTSAAPQLKFELRGYQTCIQDILIPNKSYKPAT